MNTQLRTKLNIFDIIQDYDAKVEEIPVLFEDIKSQIVSLEAKCTTMGAYGGSPFRHTFSHNHLPEVLKSLKKSSWQYVFNALNIKHIAPQTHLKHFENLLEDPPEFTEEAIKSVFKDYVTDPRGMSLQAFAEVFCGLDPFYKSHSNMRIGVKGLPKRVIIKQCGSYFNSYGWRTIAEIINCLMRYRNDYNLCVEEYKIKEIIEKGDSYQGLTFKSFLNGNCHVVFDKSALDDTNRALAEYYGEVLPDAYEHTDKKADSTEVSKDLQFYRTPKKAVEWLMGEISFSDDTMILEPSCGDGALLDGLRKKSLEKDYQSKPRYKNIKCVGVEYDQARCGQARTKGHTVHNDNFLEWQTKDRFDLVVMNPPFYGKHYAKHISKAYELLSDGGQIIAILPITAKLNHGILDEKYKCRWRDMPLGSFAESGTNINTCMVRIFKD